MNYLKKTGKLLIAACLFAGMPTLSGTISASELQTHIMSVQMESTTLKQLFNLIEEKFDYTFLIRNDDIDLNERISIDMSNRSVEEILTYALRNQQAAFVVNEDRIVVYKTNAPKPIVNEVTQQNQRVTGTVVDQVTGEPVIGANVVVKGTTIGTSTDFDGKFSFEAPVGATLVVSYIGYLNLEIQAESNMTIRLREDTQALEEVVVVGYTTQRKESLTGALNTIKSEKITNITSANVENMLTGKIPGVLVAAGTGQPGDAGKMIIRGKSTVNGSTDPLWVIDGVIVGSSPGALNSLDIETMTVLKDAASTAIYGSQGANGVILVTTKTAKSGKMTINLSVKGGASIVNHGKMEMMNGAELYDYYKSFNNQEMISFPRWNENLRNSNFDWWDLATHTGVTQDYNFSISGGNENLKSFLSLGYYDETGSVKGYEYNRYSFRFRTDYKPFDWLNIKPSLSGQRIDKYDAQYSTTAMYKNLPWDSPYDENGNIVPHRSALWVNSNTTNYIYDLQWNYSESTRYEFMGNIDFDIRITDWLTFSSINSYIWHGYSYNGYTDPRSDSGSGVQGRMQEDRTDMVRRYTNQILRFNKTFGKHAINALAAYEFNDYKYKTLGAIGIGFIPGFQVLDVTAKPEKVSGAITEQAVQSYLLNAHYAYDNKYLAEASVRRDGASNFGDNAKYGNFFSFSAGWNIHREEFFQADWIDILKLRASYGTVGNKPNTLYPQYDLYSVGLKQSYNEISGALISQIGNKDLTWEKTKTMGIGLDFNAFNNRLRFTADYYNKNTDNLLYQVPVSALTGVSSVWRNVGELENKGIEVSVGGNIVQTKDFNWSIDVNIGHNKNKIKELYGDKQEIIVGSGLNIAGSGDRLLKPGYDVDTRYLIEWAGVNPETGAPQWYKTDDNGNRVVTEKYAEANQVALGAYSPDFYGGFSTDFSWKQFDLSALFGYSVGGVIYNYSRTEYDSDGTYTDRNQMKLKKGWNRWEKPGDIATHPVPSYGNKSNANQASSRYLEDGDYLKLRSLTIGYNLSLPQYYIQNLRLFVTGENLFTITGYSGTNPEIAPTAPTSGAATQISGAVGPAVYPNVRKFMFGINITL